MQKYNKIKFTLLFYNKICNYKINSVQVSTIIEKLWWQKFDRIVPGASTIKLFMAVIYGIL